MIATAPPAEHVRETWEERRERLASSYADALTELREYVQATSVGRVPSLRRVRELKHIAEERCAEWLFDGGHVP